MDSQQITDGWKDLYDAVKYDRDKLLAENEDLRARLKRAYDTIENLSKQNNEHLVISESEIEIK